MERGDGCFVESTCVFNWSIAMLRLREGVLESSIWVLGLTELKSNLGRPSLEPSGDLLRPNATVLELKSCPVRLASSLLGLKRVGL